MRGRNRAARATESCHAIFTVDKRRFLRHTINLGLGVLTSVVNASKHIVLTTIALSLPVLKRASAQPDTTLEHAHHRSFSNHHTCQTHRKSSQFQLFQWIHPQPVSLPEDCCHQVSEPQS